MARLCLSISADRGYIEHAAMRQALRVIVDAHAESPWAFSGEDAADLAREVLEFVDAENDNPSGVA